MLDYHGMRYKYSINTRYKQQRHHAINVMPLLLKVSNQYENIPQYIDDGIEFVLALLVEPRGIEPLSESNLERTSPGAVCYLHSLTPTGTNTLRSLVAS